MRRSYVLAAVLAVAAIAWILSGQWSDGGGLPEAKKAPVALSAGPREPAVRVSFRHAELHTMETIVRGRTEARRKVTLKAETQGRIVALPLREGAWINAGDVVARLDADDRPARLKEAEALLQQRRVEFDATEKLSRKGYKAETKLAAAIAALESAAAAVSLARSQLDDIVLRAPFDGLLNLYHVEIGDFLETGNPVAELVDLDPVLVVAQVGEREVKNFTVGAQGFVRFLGADPREGTIRYIASVADPATRTFRIELEIPNRTLEISDGITAELRLPHRRVMSHYTSPAVLTLADDGEIGVKVIDRDSKVQFRPVQIIDSDASGVWLAGLPDDIWLITVGQEFVRAGQAVRAINEVTLKPAFGAGAS